MYVSDRVTAVFLSLLLILSACGPQAVPPDATPHEPSPPVESAAEPPTVYAPAVLAAAEKILDRAPDLDGAADRAALSGTRALELESRTGDLTGLGELFPNLNVLRLMLFGDEALDAEACAILDTLPSLRGVTVYAPGGIASLDFLDGLSYVELTGADLAEAALCGAETVREHMTGTAGTYVRILDGDMAYELVTTDEVVEAEFCVWHESKVFVSSKGRDGYALQTVIEDDSVENETALILCDIDFDGVKDVLVMQGHFGAQGLVRYSCYLRRGDGFVPCPSFSEIANPAVNAAEQKILSTWRNWAASHSWAMYEFQNGAFVMTDCLTSEIALEYDAEEVWRYTDVGLVDGVWQTRAVFTTKDTSEEEIWERVYAEGGYWGLVGTRWDTLYNGGSMVDFSIYGSGLNAMEAALLEPDFTD